MEHFIKNNYPDAEEGKAFTAEYIQILEEKHGFELGKTLLSTSVCSDEIIRSSTNFRDYVKNENPFTIGGLAGFPFSGLTGFRAFASHIPDGGSAIIIYGPHIGVLKDGTIGAVQRIGQHKPTSCCGALKAAVASMSGQSESEADRDLDYQMYLIQNRLKPFKGEIYEDPSPLAAVTDKMYEIIDERVHLLLNGAREAFSGCKVALIGGIIINTDYDSPDWFELRNFEVLEY